MIAISLIVLMKFLKKKLNLSFTLPPQFLLTFVCCMHFSAKEHLSKYCVCELKLQYVVLVRSVQCKLMYTIHMHGLYASPD